MSRTVDVNKPLTVYALFHQATWWQTRDGRWLRIADMDPRHRDNLLPFLERHMDRYYGRAYADARHEFRNIDGPSYGRAMSEFTFGARHWLNSTELVKALQRYADKRTPIGRLRTRLHNRTYPLRKRIGIAKS